ncbi:MAG TPA: FAD:protein FMN transferase [Candidatus Angelobacter sp.]|jgi:thiamine biosynthesis lipoprotein ApbE|nr:FAD:protein FMN transferase [Candidatus Angelobacter sp.]
MTATVADQRALGTGLRVVVTEPELLDAAMHAVDAVVRSIDETCSRFREDSEISALQRHAGRETRVSPLLMLALRAALRGARLSDGAVDPTVGSAVRNIGYDADFATVSGDGAPLRLTVTPVPGWQRIRLDATAHSVYIPDGVELDLGSTAKALAADLAATAARTAMRRGGVLVSLGGDIAVAGDAPEGGWVIQAADDSDAAITDDGESIAIRAGGVATSSTTVRRWRRGGVQMHHIVDPATGLPAGGPWRTVSVVAADCLDANIAATAAIVRGEAALAWLDHLCLPSRLVTHDGDVVRVGGWPEPGAQSAPGVPG